MPKLQTRPEAPTRPKAPTPEEAEAERTVREVQHTLRRRLSAKVRTLRMAAGLTQKAAAELGEVHWRHWQKIEAGEVNATMATIVRIARVLRVDVPVLFPEAESTENEGEAKPPEGEGKPSQAQEAASWH